MIHHAITRSVRHFLYPQIAALVLLLLVASLALGMAPHGNRSAMADAVVSFTLINADTDQPIADFDPLPENAVLDLSALPTRNLNIRANTQPATVGSVRFALDDNANARTENAAPYVLAGDSSGDYGAWTPAPGPHTVTATPYSEANGKGEAGTSRTLYFTVVEGTGPATATATATATPTATPVARSPLPPTPRRSNQAIFVFSKTEGFRHASIDAGLTALQELGAQNGFRVDASEDADLFNDTDLAQYDVVVFLNTTGDILNEEQQAAFERFIRAGNGFVGIHSATDTEYDWPWYGGLVGTYFSSHPQVQEAEIDVVDSDHASTEHLPTSWTRRDEWYNFQSDPSAGVNVLLNLDESTYEGGEMGDSHPIAWYHEYDGGRAWYTAMGHTADSFAEPLFRQHLLGGIQWAAGSTEPTATVTPSAPIDATGTVSGELIQWHPITVNFDGPVASEADDDPNPFLDYRLQVAFTGPSGQRYEVPGFFAGDGNGGSSGNVWRVRFSADEAGMWQYTASMRSGDDVAISLQPDAGAPVSFDGASGTFNIAPRNPAAPGFLRWGRLEYVGQHYRKFRDGPYWIKGGTDSPENFMGYAGFDNTEDQEGGFLHEYADHRADWRPGDPDFVSADTGVDGKGIIGALNYLSSQHVNSIYFLPMNLGGDGRETYPFVGPADDSFDKTHYDISKLDQWNTVFDHAQRRSVALHFVLAETESGNENWFDDGELGRERKLFYRELIARFGYVLAIKWNLSEESDFSVEQLRAFADYIDALDWADHAIGVHTKTNDFDDYEEIVGDERFTVTSIQYTTDRAGDHVETWRQNSAAAGQPWVLEMDENSPAGTGLTDDNADELRKEVLYAVYFSGGGIEWYAGYHELPLGGDLRLENFRTREAMWQYMWHARKFVQEQLPFWEMTPRDDLLDGEDDDFGGGHVFAQPGEVYAIYLPDASNSDATFDLSGFGGAWERRWYDPRSGAFVGATDVVAGGSPIVLGAPPQDADEDWVLLLRRAGTSTRPPSGAPVPTATPLAGPTPTSGVIHGRVFHDANDNGQSDAGEAPLPRAVLTLRDRASAGDTLTQTAITNDEGIYRFINVPPGQYSMTLALPAGYAPTGQQVLIIDVGSGNTAVPDVAAVLVDKEVFMPLIQR